MKRSELKEAIKAEIKSVLSEEIQVGDIVTLGGDGDELEVIDKREMFGSDMMAYRVKFPDGNTEEYSADQLRPTSMMNEEDEPTAADLKKKDSVATISNKLQKVTSEIKKHLAMYKDAEGDEAKKLAINMLKKLNAEKKKLEKNL